MRIGHVTDVHRPRHRIAQVLERTDLFVAPAVLESSGIAALKARCAEPLARPATRPSVLGATG